MKNKLMEKEQQQHLIDMMRDDENLGLYENWVKDAEKESNLSDLNREANIFWSAFRVGVKSKERMYEKDMIEFAEFIMKYPHKNKNYLGQILHAKSKYDGAERTIDLLKEWLEQYKKK
jgi:hypothetical protein